MWKTRGKNIKKTNKQKIPPHFKLKEQQEALWHNSISVKQLVMIRAGLRANRGRAKLWTQQGRASWKGAHASGVDIMLYSVSFSKKNANLGNAKQLRCHTPHSTTHFQIHSHFDLMPCGCPFCLPCLSKRGMEVTSKVRSTLALHSNIIAVRYVVVRMLHSEQWCEISFNSNGNPDVSSTPLSPFLSRWVRLYTSVIVNVHSSCCRLQDTGWNQPCLQSI